MKHSKLFLIFTLATITTLYTSQTLTAQKVAIISSDTKALAYGNTITIYYRQEDQALYAPIQKLEPVKNKKGEIITGHDAPISLLTYNDERKFLASADENGMVVLWIQSNLSTDFSDRYVQAQRIKTTITKPTKLKWDKKGTKFSLQNKNNSVTYKFTRLGNQLFIPYDPFKKILSFFSCSTNTTVQEPTIINGKDLRNLAPKSIKKTQKQTRKNGNKKCTFDITTDLHTDLPDNNFASTSDNALIIWKTKITNGKKKLTPLQIFDPIKENPNYIEDEDFTEENANTDIDTDTTNIGHVETITLLDYNKKYKFLASADKSGVLILWIIDKTGKVFPAQEIKTDLTPNGTLTWGSIKYSFTISNSKTITLFKFDKTENKFVEIIKIPRRKRKNPQLLSSCPKLPNIYSSKKNRKHSLLFQKHLKTKNANRY